MNNAVTICLIICCTLVLLAIIGQRGGGAHE